MLESLAQAFASGAVIDWLMLLLVVEGCVLVVILRGKGLGPALVDASCIVVPGLLLMLAIKLALTDADWRAIGAVLAAAGLVHALDVARRLRR